MYYFSLENQSIWWCLLLLKCTGLPICCQSDLILIFQTFPCSINCVEKWWKRKVCWNMTYCIFPISPISAILVLYNPQGMPCNVACVCMCMLICAVWACVCNCACIFILHCCSNIQKRKNTSQAKNKQKVKQLNITSPRCHQIKNGQSNCKKCTIPCSNAHIHMFTVQCHNQYICVCLCCHIILSQSFLGLVRVVCACVQNARTPFCFLWLNWC